MTTERDVYELDASQALDQLKKLAIGQLDFSATAEDGKMKMLAIGAAWAAGTAALSALSAAVSASAALLKDSVHDYLEAEQADLRRSRALRAVTVDVEKWNNRLAESASALERLTGVDDEYYAKLQTLLTTFGVAPAQVDRFTRAALDLAAATGQDATMAARLLARAHAEGKDELKKYGIAVDEAAFKAKGFTAVLEQVEGKFGGLHTDIPQQQKDLNNLTGAWKTFKETLGGVVANAADTSGILGSLTRGIDTLGYALHRVTQSSAQNAREDETPEKRQARMMVEADNLRRHLDGTKTMWKTWGTDVKDQVALSFKEASTQLAALEKELQPKWLKDLNAAGSGRVKTPVHVQTDEEKEANKKRMAENQKYLDQKAILFNTAGNNLLRDEKLRDAEEVTATGEKIAKLGDWEEAATQDERRQLEERYQVEHDLAVKTEEERQKMADAAAERQKAFYDGMLNDLENYGRQVLNFGAQLLEEQLTQNDTYNKAYHEALVDRRVADSEEQGAKKTAVEVEKELNQETKAAQQKRTAEFLAGIAKEAGVRALMEGAEAIASLAKYDYPGAVQHGVAAAAFGGVALATGIGAAAISGARGMTREEKDSIDSLNKRSEDKAARSAAVTSAPSGPGVQQNVYFFGISGMTDVGQGAELDRLRRKYNQLGTGA